MTVTCTSTFDPREYEAFLDGFAASPRVALAYHYPFYLRFLCDVAYPGARLRMVAARDAEGRLIGVLPGLHVARGAFKLWLSLAYFGPNAGAIVRDVNPHLVTRLVAAAADDARALGCASMTIYTPLDADAGEYLAALGTVDFARERIAQWLPLPADRDASPWPRRVRQDLRRTAQAELTVQPIATVAELDEVWEIYAERARAHGMPLKPRAHLHALFATAGERGCFLAARQRGTLVAGLVCLFGGGVISYYLPCATAEGRRLQAGLALLDDAVRRGRAAGCGVLNFEASPGGPEDPVFRFKERCGGIPVSYHVLVKLLHAGALDQYRALSPADVAREVPFAYVVPFEALTTETLER
jgi:hypothetical protein